MKYVITIMLLTTPVFGATYYIAADGNDSDPGTEESPWLTVDRAIISCADDPNVAAGDTVIFKAGNYGEWYWTAADNFTNEGDWITYQAAEDANVVFEDMHLAMGGNEVHIKLKDLNFICAGYGENQYNSLNYQVDLLTVQYVDINDCVIKGAYDSAQYGRGFKISQGSGEVCQHITIRNSEIFDVIVGIGITESNDVTIDNVTIHDLPDDCVAGADVNDLTITDCNFYNVEPWFEWSLEDEDDTVTGTFQADELVSQDDTGAAGKIIKATTESGHLMLYLDANDYDRIDGGTSYPFSWANLTDIDSGNVGGLDDFDTNDVWDVAGSPSYLTYKFRVTIDGEGTPDTYKLEYQKDGVEEWLGPLDGMSEVELTGDWQYLWSEARALMGKWDADTGHTLNDYWLFDCNEYRTVTGLSSGATMTPSDEQQANHADIIQLYCSNDFGYPCKNITIERNLFEKEEGQGIFLKQCKNVTIANNLIFSRNTTHPLSLQTSCVSANIYNNTLILNRSTANLTMNDNWYDWEEGFNYRKYYNVIVDEDANTVYGLNADSNHIAASDNKPGSGENWEDYWVDITADMVFRIHNNIITNYLNITNDSYKTLSLTHNIIGLTTGNGIPGDIAENNNVYGEQILTTALDALFTDPDTNDYTLESDSNAVGYSDKTYAPVFDLNGNERDANPDAGCYEYNADVPRYLFARRPLWLRKLLYSSY